MKYFVSYSAHDKDDSERLVLALRNLGHDVFFDGDDLPPGGEYDQAIQEAISKCDRFVFCVSKHSLRPGAYTQSELKFARQRWPHPKGKVIAVVLDETTVEEVDPYLAAATMLFPRGNAAAELTGTVARMDAEARSRRQLIVVVSLFALTCIAGIAHFRLNPPQTPEELSRDRLVARLPPRAGFKTRAYPQFGFGFQCPAAWFIDDAAAVHGVPDIDLVQRYTDKKAAIGVEFRLIPVQPNYVNDLTSEIRNQADVFRKIDPRLEVDDTTIAGIPAKRFRYEQSTGRRTAVIDRTWVRLVPEVKLQIISFTYADALDRGEFEQSKRQILDSIVVDRALFDLRSNSP